MGSLQFFRSDRPTAFFFGRSTSILIYPPVQDRNSRFLYGDRPLFLPPPFRDYMLCRTLETLISPLFSEQDLMMKSLGTETTPFFLIFFPSLFLGTGTLAIRAIYIGTDSPPGKRRHLRLPFFFPPLRKQDMTSPCKRQNPFFPFSPLPEDMGGKLTPPFNPLFFFLLCGRSTVGGFSPLLPSSEGKLSPGRRPIPAVNACPFSFRSVNPSSFFFFSFLSAIGDVLQDECAGGSPYGSARFSLPFCRN